MRYSASRVQVRNLVAQVLEGADVGARASGEAITIGTAEGSTLRLTDPGVSRFHIELLPASGGVAVIDHGSTNGTFIGGVRLERGVVAPGSVLRVGATTIRVGDAGSAEIEMFDE